MHDPTSSSTLGGKKRDAISAAQHSLDALPETLAPEEISELLNAADEIHTEVWNDQNLQRAVSQLERKIRRNTELRLQFPDDPEKFLKSEVDLDEEIKKVKQLAATSDLLKPFVDLGGLNLLIGLMNHENSDIALEVVEVVSELTDPDTVAELDEPEEFIKSLLDCGYPSLSVELLAKIQEEDSEEDVQAVSNILQVVENISDIYPAFSSVFAQEKKYLLWLIDRVRREPFVVDYNRVYALEILNILFQNAPMCREFAGSRRGADAIEKLLRVIAMYRKIDPATADEEEYLSNAVDALSALLLEPANQLEFGRAQGIELAIRLLKERRYVYRPALKLTSFAVLRCPRNCSIFVEKYGLKPLFGIFMRKGVTTKINSPDEKEDEEHVVLIICSLVLHSTKTPLARVLNKFAENSGEKIERLLELHEKYRHLVERTRIAQTSDIDKELNLDENELRYLERCENGLCILQHINIAILRLANLGASNVTERIFELLDVKGVSLEEVTAIVNEYSQHLDDEVKEKEGPLIERDLTSFTQSYNICRSGVSSSL